ncbi:hypothetical protein D3OALGA1CA_1291 [Olavius algarvensis associated proteobacterium Delta 3]|nr:hypothetical protein D3OALGB2SA_637 [Olavius algarvensis associated proteobacterium Delta 3]CAB5098749.1 hypothetical protein D3OALGA1CA_1291 [Olavius algarvensis associated proteobacterium Delta 3]
MNKFFGCLFTIFLSFALFIGIGVSTAIIVPYLSAENYEGHETPHGQFRVLVEIHDVDSGEKRLRAVKWAEFLERRDDYRAYRQPEETEVSDGPLWYRIQNITPGKQLIELKYSQENLFLYNTYHVTDERIIPLYFRISDRGDALLGFLTSLIVTPIALFFFRHFRRRPDKSIPD